MSTCMSIWILNICCYAVELFFLLLPEKYHTVRKYFRLQQKTKIFFPLYIVRLLLLSPLLMLLYIFPTFVSMPALTYAAVLALYCSSFLCERRFSLLFVWIFRIVSEQRRWIYIKYSAVFQFRLLSAAKLLHLLKGTVLYILLFAVSHFFSLSFLFCGHLNVFQRNEKIIMTCAEFQAATFALWNIARFHPHAQSQDEVA